MAAFSEDAALRSQIVAYLQTLAPEALKARPPTPPDDAGRRTRGASEFKMAPDAVDARVRDVRAFLDLFDQSADLRQLVHDLVETSVQATEQRMVDKFASLAAAAEQREHAADRRQRRDNLLLTIGSLLVGWVASLIGTPLTLLSHIWQR